MSQGNDFANYGSAAADKPEGEDGLWYVAIASDDIKTMTLDQLDEAFRLGVISAETSVWTEGMEAWAPLREVAGLEDGDDSSESLENEETVARGQSAPAGLAAHGYAAPQNSYAPPQQSSYAPPAQSFQSPFGAVVESSNQGAGSLSPFGLSTAPVALNVDEDMPPMRGSRGLRPQHWAIGGVAVLGLGIALYTGLFSSSAASEQPVSAAAVTPQVTGLALSAKQADPADEADEAPATKPAAAEEKKEVAAADEDEAADEKPAVDAKKVAGAAAAAAPAAAALKGSVSDALRSNKKGASTRQASILKRKPAKKARATGKAKRATASKSVGGPSKGGSAFDPLNDSLP
jgi:uncharacterized protein DUF4339